MTQVVKINILKKKDQLTEQFLLNFLNVFEREYEETHPSYFETGADRRQEDKLMAMKQSLNRISLLLSHRYQTMLSNVLVQREESHLDDLLGHIQATSLTPLDMAMRYKKCFDAFMSSPEISFKARNVQLLGKVAIQDQFILTLWSMLTVRRQSGDNLLQLICSGASSTGKTGNTCDVISPIPLFFIV